VPGDAARFGLGHLAAKADQIAALAPVEFPGVAVGQPCFGQFDLPAIVDALTEHAVQVTDAIAIGRDVEAGEALHEAGRQTPQTAIAQRRIGLQFFQLSQIQAMLAQGLPSISLVRPMFESASRINRPIRNSRLR
jgi:hypothetical protein